MSIEEHLQNALKSKDHEKIECAFEDIYNEYYKLVYYVSYNIVKNSDDAEEIMNSTFLNFYNHLNSIEFTSIKYYLTTSARNLSLNYLRDKQKYELADDITIDTSNYKYNESYKSEHEDSLLLFKIRELLDDDDYYLITERILYDTSYKDIAKHLNITEGHARIRYHRVVKKLKKELGGFNNEQE